MAARGERVGRVASCGVLAPLWCAAERQLVFLAFTTLFLLTEKEKL